MEKKVSKLKRIEKISCLQYTCIYTKNIKSFISFYIKSFILF